MALKKKFDILQSSYSCWRHTTVFGEYSSLWNMQKEMKWHFGETTTQGTIIYYSIYPNEKNNKGLYLFKKLTKQCIFPALTLGLVNLSK